MTQFYIPKGRKIPRDEELGGTEKIEQGGMNSPQSCGDVIRLCSFCLAFLPLHPRDLERYYRPETQPHSLVITVECTAGEGEGQMPEAFEGKTQTEWNEGRKLVTCSVQPQKLAAMTWLPDTNMPVI